MKACIDCAIEIFGHPNLKRCVECRKTREKARARARDTAAWAKTNPERARANKVAWRKANPEYHRAHNAAWNRANPQKRRDLNLKWTRGSKGVLNPTSERKSGACYNGGCTYVGPLVFDHHHTGPKAGQFRGWLCNECNIGRFREDPARLRGAADYFELALDIGWPEC